MKASSYSIVWVAWMSRWGEHSPTHAYAEGVFADIYDAKAAGTKEESYRGGKYMFQHCPAIIDNIELDIDNMLVIEPIEINQVYVASVSRANCRASIVHFLGCFSSHEKAVEYGNEMYPGWKVDTILYDVRPSSNV